MLSSFGNYVKVMGAYNTVTALSGIVSQEIQEDMDKELEKAAKKLTDSMKSGIARERFGLKKKSEFTLRILEKRGDGGKTIPLVVNGDLLNSITYQEYKGEDIVFKKGGVNRFKAFFCGVQRTAGPHNRSGQMFDGEKYKMGTVYIAKLLVLGFVAKLPKGGRAKVPPRDFVTPAKEEFWSTYGQQFAHGVARSWRVRAFGGTSSNFTNLG